MARFFLRHGVCVLIQPAVNMSDIAVRA